MGKKQHSKDRLYITSKEWKEEWGGKKDTDPTKFLSLPFYCCCISLLPFKDPYCTREGAIFDVVNIIPFIKKYAVNPIDGNKLELKDLIKLKFHKNSEGFFHCPILFRQFTESSHIVAVATTGNVYSYEAVSELNLKGNNMKDLLNDSAFKRSDVIILQDPKKLDCMNVINFYHVKNQLRVKSKQDHSKALDILKNTSYEAESIIKEINETFKEPEMSFEKKEDEPVDEVYRIDSIYSKGGVSCGFTSTLFNPDTKQVAKILDKDLVRYERVKKKGYAQIKTDFGNLNFELHCDLVPKTCENFILLAKRNYYNNTTFHRLVVNFVLQGGDPTATGRGGESAWGGTFKDEFHSDLKHNERGILSMANQGKDTNKSQFFILLRGSEHLNNKHTVFGRLVGGLDVLDKIEIVESDEFSKPKIPINILSVSVFVDPFEEVDEILKKEYLHKQSMKNKENIGNSLKNSSYKRVRSDDDIGKYLKISTSKEASSHVKSSTEPKTAAPKKSKYGNFDNW